MVDGQVIVGGVIAVDVQQQFDPVAVAVDVAVDDLAPVGAHDPSSAVVVPLQAGDLVGEGVGGVRQLLLDLLAHRAVGADEEDLAGRVPLGGGLDAAQAWDEHAVAVEGE